MYGSMKQLLWMNLELLMIVFFIVCTSIETMGSLKRSRKEKAISGGGGVGESVTVVPVEKEIKFYKEVDKIDPVVLRILMSNITEEPKIRSTPNHHCCFNGGTCHVPTMNEEDRWCSCPRNFTGRYCDVDVDECLNPNACKKHQTCTNTYGSFKCECQQGFAWDIYRCVAKSSCYTESCENFGQCVEKDNGLTMCICPLGFAGKKCELKLLDCDDSSCTEEEICVATSDGFQCVLLG